jgi:hypothetical protein
MWRLYLSIQIDHLDFGNKDMIHSTNYYYVQHPSPYSLSLSIYIYIMEVHEYSRDCQAGDVPNRFIFG